MQALYFDAAHGYFLHYFLQCFAYFSNGPVRFLYTCSAQCDPDYSTALEALDLAHRWQVDVVVPILADLLSGTVDSVK